MKLDLAIYSPLAQRQLSLSVRVWARWPIPLIPLADELADSTAGRLIKLTRTAVLGTQRAPKVHLFEVATRPRLFFTRAARAARRILSGPKGEP